MRDVFHRFAHRVSDRMGSPWAFFAAVAVIVAWAVTGPVFGYSDTWQLYINTGTTIATFLMVFLIQNTQNRDAKAIHLKLDELLRGVKGARTSLVHLEEWTDDELSQLADQFERLRHRIHRSPHGAKPPSDAVQNVRHQRPA
ncbi:MAG: low affinity iron permease family protein [Candidatus Rokubacteria bacterium]|nr:low affinity iron permease family protein [Candidatus Rokubacteria bacterium]